MGRVLLVDDDDDIRDLVSLRLGMDGHSVSSFGAPHDALACASTTDFDVVILDWTMPDMDGGDLCGRLRELPGLRDAPILVVTAHADPLIRDQAFTAGATDYIPKPFSLHELAATVRTLLVPAR